jgi:hypothetical protein
LYLCSRIEFSKTDNFLKVQNKKVSQNGKLFVRDEPKLLKKQRYGN